MTKEDIVITGISARYPQADSLSELKEKLFARVDLVTNDDARWPAGFLGIPERKGTIKDLSRFDASFFGVLPKQAQLMDPQLRYLLETSYEAIVDAGYDPATLRGRKIGVFVGCGLSETLTMFATDSATIDGYIVTGSALHMFSNRVSYCLDFSGPSLTVDSASASTMQALSLALHSLRSGECEAAIVGGSNIMVNPLSTLCEFRFGILSVDGKCKTFNANEPAVPAQLALCLMTHVSAPVPEHEASIIERSSPESFTFNSTTTHQSVTHDELRLKRMATCEVRPSGRMNGAMFLQPVSQARRIYAKLINAKANSDGYKVEGITVPSSKKQEQLLREVYSEAKVDPLTVTYVEAHGTGTTVGDPQEMAALSRFFGGPERKKPLKVGAVKSCVGHAEAASSIATISKVIILMETGMIPPNLHFTELNPRIPCLHDGSIEVVAEATPFDGGPVGIDAFGFGGTNVHAIFEANPGPHVDTMAREKPGLPRLVLVAGRTDESLKKTLDRLEVEGPYPDSAYALLNRVGQPGLKLFPYRGYAVVPVDGSDKPVTKVVEKVIPAKRPLWFVFTGMGCQWNGMARQMMEFDVFARSIRASHDLLAKNFGLDLIDLVTSEKPRGQETVASVQVSIVAIQVALVDVIRAIGLRPDGIVGHSLGEISSAYADEGLTAEEAMLCAYWRGRCTDVANLPRGAMAAVGLTWEEVKRRGRDGVEAACHNAEDSVTVSGPADAVAELVKELRAEELFARVVNTMDVAFHSAQMQRVGPALLKHYKEVIPEPKTRGNRWISSSVPESRWGQPIAQHCSAEYFVNNLVSPVLFCEALRHVPRDAIVVEFAPHCLLLSILRRELGSGASCVGLMKKDVDNHSFFLGSLGKLHTLGVQLDPSALYPPVPWPLPRGTPNIGHLVSWDHTQQWAVASWRDVPTLAEGKDDIFDIDVHGNEDNAYLAGHRLAGEVTIPVGIHLLLAWKSLSRRHGKPAEEVPVIFENVKVHRNVLLPETGTVRLVVTIMYSSGEFEVCEEGTVAASGSIRIDDAGDPSIDADTLAASAEKVAFDLDSEDVYKELTVRGYDYLGDFRGILKADVREPCGKLRWKKNWVTFVDSVIQFVMFRSPDRVLRMPTTIEFLRFDPCVHAGVLEKSGDTGVEVVYNKITDTCHAGGVVIRGICTDTVYSDVEEQKAVVEEYHFVPYFDDTDSKDKRESLTREYAEVCCSVARRALGDCFEGKSFACELMNDLRDVPEHVVKQYLKERREGHGLLRFLHDVQKQAERPGTSLSAYVQSALPTHKEDLEADVLNTALFEEDPLRFLFDIAVENSSPKSFQILELAARGSDLLLVTWLAKYISEYSLVPATQYIVAHPSPERVSGKVPQGTTVMPLGSASSKKKLPEADLIVTRSATWIDKSGATDVAEELSVICRENGFVLLAQRAALTPVESVIGEIGGLRPAATSADEVQAQFSKHGLRLVAFKSNNLSALYLFRKRSMALEEVKQEIVPVDGETGDLVDSVKRKALDYEWKPRGENMWLLAEEAGTSGVIGLANCLRHESGGGHTRCVFDAGSSGISKVADFSATRPEYKDVMEKDLVMNVYRNGRWGSYRHVVAKSYFAKMNWRTVNFAGYVRMTMGLKMAAVHLAVYFVVYATAKNTRFAVLNVGKRGDPSSLDWYESPVPYNTPPATKGATAPVMCDVHFAAVNSRDVRFATGHLLPETVAGMADMAISGSILGQEFSGTDQTGLRVMGLVTGQALATVVAADPVLLWEVPDTWTMTEASTVPLSYATVYNALLVRGNMRPGESVLVHSGSGCLGQAAIAVALSMGCIVFASVGSAREGQFLKDRFPQLEDGNVVNYKGLCLEEYILDQTKGKGVDLVFHSLQSANRDVIIHCLAANGRYLFHDAADKNSPSLPSQGLSSKRKVLNVTVIRADALHANDPSVAEEKRRVAELVREGISSGAVKPLPVTVFAREQASHAFTPEACEASTNKKVVLQIRHEGSHQTEDSSPPFTIEAIARTYFYTHKAYVVVGEASSVALELVDWMVTRGCRKVLLTGGRGMVTGYQRLCLHRWQTAGASVVLSEVDVSAPQGALQVIKDAEAMGPVGGIFNISLCHEDGLTADRATRKIDYKTKVDGARHLDEHSRKVCSQLDHFVVFSSMCSGRGTPGRSLSGYVDSALERLCERRAADGFPGLAIQWGSIDGNSLNDSQSTEAVYEGTQPQRMKSFLEVTERFLNQSHPIVSSFVKAEVQSSSDKKSEKNHLVDSVIRILGFQDSSTLNQDSSLGELGLDSIMGVQMLKVLEESTGLALSVQGIRHVTLNDLRAMSEERRVN